MRHRLPLLVLLLPLISCASILPFSEVRGALPEERFVRLGDQLVHVEQAGKGDPVVLLHGFGASTYSWRKVIPALAESFRVVAIDLNGFGYTQRPESFASYTREGQAELVLRVMDALEIESAHLIGHSYGGGLTLWIASRHPSRVRSMVLVDSSAPTYANDRRSRAAAWRPLNSLFLRVWVLHPRTVRRALLHSFYDDSLVTPELVGEYFDRIRIEGVTAAYYGLTAPAPGETEPVELTEIKVPALVVWGVEDELVPLAGGRKAAGLMPNAELAVMERVGHVPMEERPEEWLRLVIPFLRQQQG